MRTLIAKRYEKESGRSRKFARRVGRTACRKYPYFFTKAVSRERASIYQDARDAPQKEGLYGRSWDLTQTELGKSQKDVDEENTRGEGGDSRQESLDP